MLDGTSTAREVPSIPQKESWIAENAEAQVGTGPSELCSCCKQPSKPIVLRASGTAPCATLASDAQMTQVQHPSDPHALNTRESPCSMLRPANFVSSQFLAARRKLLRPGFALHLCCNNFRLRFLLGFLGPSWFRANCNPPTATSSIDWQRPPYLREVYRCW